MIKAVPKDSTLVKEARKANQLDKIVEHEMIRDKELGEMYNTGLLRGCVIGFTCATVGAMGGMALATIIRRT